MASGGPTGKRGCLFIPLCSFVHQLDYHGHRRSGYHCPGGVYDRSYPQLIEILLEEISEKVDAHANAASDANEPDEANAAMDEIEASLDQSGFCH